MDDRRVHARLENGVEIVRYDRAGKWYAERDDARERIGINEAVAAALRPGSRIEFGVPGGKSFDSKVRRRRGF